MGQQETIRDNVGRDRTVWDAMGRYGTTSNICEKPNVFSKAQEPQDFKQQHFKLKTSNNNPIISDHERL